ncbi:MAG TPA: tetratricopeptide repeat protein [Spirochaetota bacterium]|nr:tetratricopeptide repeat protein [Spirochaetota bacterium]
MLIGIAIGAVVLIFIILLIIKKLFSGENRYLKQALNYESQGDYNQALLIYDRLISENKATPELRWRIANVALKVNIVQRAEKELSILISTNNLPTNVSLTAVKILLAECYIKSKDTKRAFAELYELIKNNVAEPKAYFEIAKIYASQAKTNKAIANMEKYLSKNPTDGEANFFLGKCYLDIGNKLNALESFEKAQRYNVPDSSGLSYYLGILYYAEKKYNIAMQHFTNIIKNKSSQELLGDAHRFLALCYKQKGLVDEAITNFEQSKIYSKKVDTKNMSKDDMFNEGVLLYKKGQYHSALDIFQKLLLAGYKQDEVQKIISTIKGKIKGDEKGIDNFSETNENLLNNILKRGLLFGRQKFDIDKIEQEVEKGFTSKQKEKEAKSSEAAPKKGLSIYDINKMETKDFKDISRKLVSSLGFEVKSEPKFSGDQDYIAGNAINFLLTKADSSKGKREILFTIRRYEYEIEEMNITNFLDWVDEKGYSQGIFIGSNKFTQDAMDLAKKYPNIKFIDSTGLSKMLERII